MSRELERSPSPTLPHGGGGKRGTRLRVFLTGVYDAAGYMAAFFVFGIFVVMIAQTLMREAGLRTSGADDLTKWFSAAAAFLALAHTFRHGDFVRVTLVIEHIGARARRVMETVALAIAAAFCGYLAFWATRSTYESWLYHEMSDGVIAVPMWIPQVSFAIGTILLAVAVVDQLIVVIRGGKPVYVQAVEERHARGDYSEDI
jgi:TRAP-type C4-dicarboxylate transport system permease small subunit